MWLGVLARVTRSGLTVCRPRIDRGRWVPALSWPMRATLRCGSLRARFAKDPGADTEWVGYFDTIAWARINGRGLGFAWHLGHDY